MITKAAESRSIQRTRRKIEGQILQEREQFTPASLEAATHFIHQWLARHSGERIDLKDRTVYRGAETSKSRSIQRLMHKLQTPSTAAPKQLGQLGGRISQK